MLQHAQTIHDTLHQLGAVVAAGDLDDKTTASLGDQPSDQPSDEESAVQKEQQKRQRESDALDEALAETFPTSDPVSPYVPDRQ